MAKKEIIFIIIGVMLSIMIVGFLIYSINFLTDNIKISLLLDQNSIAQKIIRFDLEGFKKLGLIK